MNKHQTIGEYIDILGENLYMLKKNPDYKPKGFLVMIEGKMKYMWGGSPRYYYGRPEFEANDLETALNDAICWLIKKNKKI